jgi:hypothetical protein
MAVFTLRRYSIHAAESVGGQIWQFYNSHQNRGMPANKTRGQRNDTPSGPLQELVRWAVLAGLA